MKYIFILPWQHQKQVHEKEAFQTMEKKNNKPENFKMITEITSVLSHVGNGILQDILVSLFI